MTKRPVTQKGKGLERDIFEIPDNWWKVGQHVRVIGAGHPQFGREGRITEILGVRVAIGNPRAMIKLDDESGFIVVSLKYLGPGGTFVQSEKAR